MASVVLLGSIYSYFGGLGTGKDAVSAIGFTIYQTEEMENLISWMREYNKSAAQGNDIRFYGFDMQRKEYNYQYLLEAVKNAGMDAEELEKIWDQDKQEYKDGYTAEQREKIIGDVKEEFDEKDTIQNASAIHLADVLLQNMGTWQIHRQCRRNKYPQRQNDG